MRAGARCPAPGQVGSRWPASRKDPGQPTTRSRALGLSAGLAGRGGEEEAMIQQRDRSAIWWLAPLLIAAGCSETTAPGIQISSADPVNGLRGTVTSRTGDDVLTFESKVNDGVL